MPKRLFRTTLFAALVASHTMPPALADSVEITRLDPDRFGQRFGAAVAVSGDTAAVGKDFGETVFTYGRNVGGDNAWGRIGTLNIGYVGAQFGSELVMDGTTLAVGAPSDQQSGPTVGTLFIYERDTNEASGWRLTKQLPDIDYATHRFAESIDLQGDYALASGYRAPDDVTGAVYVLRRDLGGADNWGLEAQLLAPDPVTGDGFGSAVAIDADTIAVGRRVARTVEVYTRSGGPGSAWAHAQTVTPESGTGNEFGFAIDLIGDTMAVAARGEAYTFARGADGVWRESGYVDAPGGLREFDIELIDNYLLAGALAGDSPVANDSGTLFVYAPDRKAGGRVTYHLTDTVFASDGIPGANFAIAAAIDDRTLFVGANNHDAAGIRAGAAYVFELDLATEVCDVVLEPPAPFGGVALGAFADDNVVISNAGQAACEIAQISRFGDSDFFFVDGLPPTPFTLQPGESVQIPMRFLPMQEGLRSGSLRVFSPDADPGLSTAPVSGEGLDPDCSLSITSQPADLSKVPVGASLATTLTLSSIGFSPCTITSAEVTGAEDFSLPDATLPLTIARGDPPTVWTVLYAPDDISEHSATVVVQSDDSQTPVQQFDFSGSGVDTCNRIIEPTELSFGLVPPGEQTVRFIGITLDTNPAVPNTCTVINVQTPDEPVFTVSQNPGGEVLAPGETVFATITYAPPQVGDYAGLGFIGLTPSVEPLTLVPLTGSSDADIDGDGVADSMDNCTTFANPSQLDTDNDGFGNACDQDLNGDCLVNGIDLGIFRTMFFQTNQPADFNGDGIVAGIDLGIFRQRFFGETGPSAFASCPAPMPVN